MRRNLKRRVRQAIYSKQVRRFSLWLLGSIAVCIMLVWNWKLVLSTGSGIGLMLLVYLMQGWNWQEHWVSWRQFLHGSNGKLTLAVGSGGFAALSTYMAASIWADSENRWLATGTILQVFGTLLTLALLLWQMATQQLQHHEAKFEQWLSDLTDGDQLKRLIAVRQLTNLVKKTRLSASYQQQLIEYFCLMLSVEQEPLIRQAVLESLQLWECQLDSQPQANFLGTFCDRN